MTGIENLIELTRVLDRTDEEIQAEVEQRLRWDTLIDDGLIDVEVVDGHVQLSGTVGSAAERRRAYSDAWVRGVQGVGNERLEVARWARDEELRAGKYAQKTDAEIREAVQDALLYDPRVQPFGVNVTVEEGEARLCGTVDNLKARRAARRTAENTVGIQSVENYLRVRPAAIVSDAAIEQNIRDALGRDIIVEAAEITVAAENGVVRLSGAVDSIVDKEPSGRSRQPRSRGHRSAQLFVGHQNGPLRRHAVCG